VVRSYAPVVRIGTWNLEGKWSSDHERVLVDLACDVWLLTESRPDARLAGHSQLLSLARMGEVKHWAAIVSRWPIVPVPAPHPATVAGEIEGLTFCCSVLPWPRSGAGDPWSGDDHPARMAATLDAITAPLAGRLAVWGGDWNQPLVGNLAGFSRMAQQHLTAAIGSLGVQVPTSELPSRNGVQASIDHIAVPGDWHVTGAGRELVPVRLSDHDVYWVEGGPTSAP
jgi:hypothetical protein